MSGSSAMLVNQEKLPQPVGFIKHNLAYEIG